MRNPLCLVLSALISALIVGAQPPQKGARPGWAFLVPDKDQPPREESAGEKHIPGSAIVYTDAQIDDLANPPDWFPGEHGSLPPIIQHGKGAALACGSCHLLSGHGHPESADLSGMPVEYLVRQMADFKSGARIDPARMNVIAKAISDEDVRQSAEWFASLKPKVWVRVVESDTVPRSFVSSKGRMRLPLPGGGTEPLGDRIIELPEDAARATSRDPHSGFVAYVPKGSVAEGQRLATTGGGGKTINCGICHDDSLKGLGDVPRIAGLHPIYIVRQLYNFQAGTSHGTSAALMKKVVANLSERDMLSLAAYAAAQAP